MTGRLRELSGRTPLRIKLVAALTALVALALLVTGLAAAAALRGYLIDRVDANLRAAVARPGALNVLRPDGAVRGLRRVDQYAVQVSAPDGTVLRPFVVERAGVSAPALPPLTPEVVRAHGRRPFTVATSGSVTRWRVVLVPVQLGVGAGVAAVAAPLGEVDSTVGRLVLLELAIGAAVLVCFAGLGYAAVRSSLRPLAEVEQTAAAIAAGDLTRRVPQTDPRTEVGRLSLALNGMLGQIEQAFRSRESSEASARQSEERMRRFVADASHELRTPLTSIRGFAELYRQGAVTDGGELDRVMRRVEDEAARMGLLVDDLLLLARVDRQRPFDRAPVDLLQLARDAVHDASAVAPGRKMSLEAGDGDPAVVMGDDSRLRQVVANLVANALAHTPEETPVVLRVSTDAATATASLEVVDRGPGLSPEQSARVFERFYRADASRSRAHGGSGLGLSIVAALVAAHGGRVEVDSRPGEGATFRVLLPLAAP